MGTYLEAVRERVVVFDGAMGTYLQLCDLGPDDFGGAELEGCNEVLVDTRPEVIAQQHQAFFEVGVDVVETNSFGSFSTVLVEYGLEHRAHELSFKSARIAREVADGYGGWVAGSMGPGTKMPTLGHISFTQLRDSYAEQARGLLEGGVDLLLVETSYDLLQAKAAIIGGRRAMVDVGREVPVQVQVTMEATGRMMLGSEIGAALTSLVAMRPDVFGLNCATGPKEMHEHLRYLSQQCPVPIAVLPNAGLPSVVQGRTHYDLTPPELAEHHKRFITELGVSVVGGCCGTSPEHLRCVVEVCKNLTPARREIVRERGAASMFSHVPYDQSPSVLLVGERTNANGSKQFKDAMLAADWDACVNVATEQIKEGAHALDVCVDYVGRDGALDMAEVAARFANLSTLPLMFDSTETPVLRTGLERFGGKALLNSANLEDGDGPDSRFHNVMSLAQEFGAAVVCLTIEEAGQARTAEDKLRIATRIRDLAVDRYGLDPGDLFFDALALTLATGQEESRRDG
ncbi:MAG TPA: homocysteine S-methyltransferase family protein, partial [Acidimicrobiales bacterium]|nr:homocysteine S-methyltransferase family protein [Acidimicrobiales bacterium]